MCIAIRVTVYQSQSSGALLGGQERGQGKQTFHQKLTTGQISWRYLYTSRLWLSIQTSNTHLGGRQGSSPVRRGCEVERPRDFVFGRFFVNTWR